MFPALQVDSLPAEPSGKPVLITKIANIYYIYNVLGSAGTLDHLLSHLIFTRSLRWVHINGYVYKKISVINEENEVRLHNLLKFT